MTIYIPVLVTLKNKAVFPLYSVRLYDSLFNCKNFPFLFFLIHVLFPVQQQTYILFKQKCIIFGCVDEYFQINTFDFTDPELTFGHK